MEKIEKPKNLIRYASEEEIETGKRNLWNARSIAYTSVLFILMGIMSFMLIGRKEIESTITRTPGQLYQKLDHDLIQNLYQIQIANKTTEDKTLPDSEKRDVNHPNHGASVSMDTPQTGCNGLQIL